MHPLTSIVNEDERLEAIQLDATQSEFLPDSAAPLLGTPAALVAAVAVANAIW